ncbi:hypothetical protein [Mesorhizobium caraganae]|uniref:hypothetical protein n=1 Tax=Mesorhizobium caraganae TaxID=483206 RepID=UPI00333A1083
MLADVQSDASGARENYAARLAAVGQEIKPFRDLLSSLASIDAKTEYGARSQVETAIKTEFRKLVARLPNLSSNNQLQAQGDLPIETHYHLWAELLSRPVQTGMNEALGRGLVLDLWDIWVAGAVGEDLAEDGGQDQGAPEIIRPSVIRDLLGTAGSVFADLLGDTQGFPIATVEKAALEIAKLTSGQRVYQASAFDLRAVLYALLRLERQGFRPEAQGKGAKAILDAAANLKAFEASLGEHFAPPDYSAVLAGIEVGQDGPALSSEAYSILLFLSGHAASISGEYGISTMDGLVARLVQAEDSGTRESVDNLLAYWAACHPIFGHALTDLFGHAFWKPQKEEGPQPDFPSPSICDLWVTVLGPRQVGKTSFMYATRAALNEPSPDTAGLVATINPFEIEMAAVDTLRDVIMDNQRKWTANKKIEPTHSANNVVGTIDTPSFCRLQFFDVAGELLWEPKDQAPKPELVGHVQDRHPRAIIFFDANDSDDLGAKYEKIIQAVFVENEGAGPRPPVYIIVNKSDAILDLYPEAQRDLLYEALNCDAADLQDVRRATGTGSLPFFSMRSFDFASGGQAGPIAKTTDGIVASLHQYRGIARRPLFRHRLALDLRRLEGVINAFLTTDHEDISLVYACSLSKSRGSDHLHPVRALWMDLTRRLVAGTAASRNSGLKELLDGRIEKNLKKTDATFDQLRQLSQDSRRLDLDTTKELNGEDPEVTPPENTWASVVSKVKQINETHYMAGMWDGISHAVRNARRFRKPLRTATLELVGEAGIDLNAHMGEIVNALPKFERVEQTVADEHVKDVMDGLKRLAEGPHPKLRVDKFPEIEAELKRIMRHVLAKPIGVAAAAPIEQTLPDQQPFVRRYSVTTGVEAGTESLVWEKRVRPFAEAAIGAAAEGSTIKEFLGWRSEDGADLETPPDRRRDLVNALYGVSLGTDVRYPEQWLRQGSKDIYQFKVLTGTQRSARTAYRNKVLEILGQLLETRETLSKFDFGRFVDVKMVSAIITYLSASTGDLSALIAAFASPESEDSKQTIQQSPLNTIREQLSKLATAISAFDSVHDQTLKSGNRRSDGWLDNLFELGGSNARLVKSLNEFQTILSATPMTNEVLTTAREQLSNSPWTQDRLQAERNKLPDIVKAIDDVQEETQSSHLLVEAAFEAFERIGKNDQLAEQLARFRSEFGAGLGGVVRTEQFAADIEELRRRRRYLTLAYAAQYVVESAWIEGAASARLPDANLKATSTSAGDLQKSVSGKIFGDPAKQTVSDKEVDLITADLRLLCNMMSEGGRQPPSAND